MSLIDVVTRLLLTAAIMLVVAGWLLVGPARLREVRASLPTRLRVAAPFLATLALVLVAEKVARDLGPEVSWVIGVNVTGLIYRIEGDLVAYVQSLATPELTAYLSFVYLAGYVFLLVFPIVAYFALANPLPLKQTAVAYTANYAVGLVCYVLFIAYGPRNLIPDAVDPLLYSTYPAVQLLTSEVNTNVNVFPSLHASLSTTVAIMAYRTRDAYRGWFLLATPLAASVALSTMYLGIHWAVDVVAGVLLGAISVYLAETALPSTEADEATGWGTPG